MGMLNTTEPYRKNLNCSKCKRPVEEEKQGFHNYCKHCRSHYDNYTRLVNKKKRSKIKRFDTMEMVRHTCKSCKDIFYFQLKEDDFDIKALMNQLCPICSRGRF